MVRCGFRTAGFRNFRLEAALDAIAQAGYDCVELCLDGHGLAALGADPLRKLVEELAARRLEVCSFSYHGDGEGRDARWANIRRSLALARACGVGVLILNGDRLAPGEQHDTALAEFIRRARPLAAEAGPVRLAVEPEPGLAVGDLADMQQVLAELPCPPLAVNLDIGHAFLTDDLAASFASLGPCLVHMHVEDMRRGVHKHLLPGAGDIDLRQVKVLADSVGYKGPWVIDLFSADADPFVYCGEALRRLRAIIGED